MLQKNIRYLMGDMSVNALAKISGVKQPTLSRGLKSESWSPDLETLDKVAKALRVSPDDLRFTDIEGARESGRLASARPLESDRVHIALLNGFELPKGGLLDRLSPFDHLDVSEAWFRFNIAGDPGDVRFAIQRDDSLLGEINAGDIVFINTAATDLEREGEGIYAFTLFGLNQIKHVQVPRQGALMITGTRRSTNAVLLEGKELQGLKVHGRVVAKLALSRI